MCGVATWPSYVEAVAAVLAGVGTVAAVWVALFLQPLREKQQKPRLKLEPPQGTGYGAPADAQLLKTVTLQVEAEKGRKSAEDVEILATVRWYSRKRPDDAPIIQFESRPLPWYESDETDGPKARMHIAPGMSRRVELLRVGPPEALYEWLGWPRTPDSYVPDETAAFAIPPKPKTIGSRPLIQDYLDWEIRFDVTARDIDTVSYLVKLAVKTEWEPPSPGGDSSKPDAWKELKGRRVHTDIDWRDFRRVS